MCLFCDKSATCKFPLRKTSTKCVSDKVQECAKIVQDTLELENLADRDMISQGALYHVHCLSEYYRRTKQTANGDETVNDKENSLHETIYSDIVSHIEEPISEIGRASCRERV